MRQFRGTERAEGPQAGGAAGGLRDMACSTSIDTAGGHRPQTSGGVRQFRGIWRAEGPQAGGGAGGLIDLAGKPIRAANGARRGELY